MTDWTEVTDTTFEREWEHSDGHRLEIEQLTVTHTHPDEYEDYQYAVRLVLDTGRDFILNGIEEDNLDNAVEVADEILDL